MLKYLRHISIPEIGIDGQKKIHNAKILIVGAGGLGIPAAMYLAASGVGTLGVIDFDTIEESNLGRQVLYSQKDIGQKKVNRLSFYIENFHPDVKLISYDVELNKKNAHIIMENYDLVVNGSDNFKTRYVINEVAVNLGIPWIDAAVTGLNGQITNFIPGRGCYSCLFPDLKDNEKNCSTEGVLSPLCGMFGSWLAIQAIKILLNLNSNNLSDFQKFYIYDIRNDELKTLKWKKREDCSVCETTRTCPAGSVEEPQALAARRSEAAQATVDAMAALGHEAAELQLRRMERSDERSFDEGSASWACPRQQELGIEIKQHNNANTLFVNLTSSPFSGESQLYRDGEKNLIHASINDFFSSSLEEPAFIKNVVKKYFDIQYFVFYCEWGIKSKIAAKILQEEGYHAEARSNS